MLYLTTNIVQNQYHQDYLFCMAIGNSDGTLSSISRFKIPSIIVDIVGYCNGLVCITESYCPIIYLWNPYIRKIKTVTGTTLTVKERDTFKSNIGFAYHSQELYCVGRKM